MSKKKIIIIVAIVAIVLLLIVGIILGVVLTTAPKYSITLAPTENGSISANVGNNKVSHANEGETITVVVVPNNSYDIAELYYIVNNSQNRVDIDFTNGNFSFVMPANDITIYVVYNRLHKINTDIVGEGSFEITVNGQSVSEAAEESTVVVSPNLENNTQVTNIYYVVEGTNIPVPIVVTEGEYSFVMPNQNITIHIKSAVATEGVNYVYDDTLQGYVVTGYSGTQKDIVLRAAYDDNTNGLHSVVGIVNNKLYASCFPTTITSVQIPYSIKNIDDYAFYNCIKLSSIDLQCVQSIGAYAFASTQIVDANLANANSIGSHAFYRCTKLLGVKLGDNLTQLPDYAFGSCSQLTSINLNKVTVVGANAFDNCMLLSNIVIDNVTTIGNAAFTNCYSLTTINLPKISTIGYGAFYACSALNNLTIGATLNSIQQDTFQLCTALTTINYEGGIAQWKKIVSTPLDIGLDYAQTTVKCQDGVVK